MDILVRQIALFAGYMYLHIKGIRDLDSDHSRSFPTHYNGGNRLELFLNLSQAELLHNIAHEAVEASQFELELRCLCFALNHRIMWSRRLQRSIKP